MSEDLQPVLDELRHYRVQQEELLEKLTQIEKPVWVQDGHHKKLLRISEISFITTNARGLDIYTTSGEVFKNFDSIANLEKTYAHDKRLMKTHRSYIVNLDQIDTIQTISGGRILRFKGLKSDFNAKVTHEYLTSFLERLGAF